jgi:hypothetical protein
MFKTSYFHETEDILAVFIIFACVVLCLNPLDSGSSNYEYNAEYKLYFLYFNLSGVTRQSPHLLFFFVSEALNMLKTYLKEFRNQ